jgi:hypothetical protein
VGKTCLVVFGLGAHVGAWTAPSAARRTAEHKFYVTVSSGRQFRVARKEHMDMNSQRGRWFAVLPRIVVSSKRR